LTELSKNALSVCQKRYFLNDKEAWQECCQRSGYHVGQIETNRNYIEKFGEMIYNLDFLPAGRILRNSGRPRGSMLNCYVLPCGDSIEEIFINWKAYAGILWSEGGGTGVNLSSLRPENAIIKGKGGTSSGPVSFLKTSDADAECIRIGGGRRAAGLAMLNVLHPDILQFMDAKLQDGLLKNYNISVAVTEDFLTAVEKNIDWEFKFNQQSYGKMKARKIWNRILENMIKSAEPGLINWDNLSSNNSYYFDRILATNPSLRKGTKILTNEGIIPIEKLQDKQFAVPNIKNSCSNATCFLSGKNKRLYRIKLQGGYEYFATAEHKWPTIIKDKWHYKLNDFNKKRTNELNKGDYLPQSTKKISLNYGNIGSYADGFLIGWNIGDGWQSNNDRPLQIGFIVAEEDQKYDIHNILTKKLKKLGWTGEFKDRRNNKETNINNKNLVKFFERFGVTKKEFGIPKAMWNNANEKFRKGFIDALFSSDGHIGNKITLTTSHNKLAYDVAELLGFYGIQSSVSHTTTKGGIFPNGKKYDKIYHTYRVVISRQSSIHHFHKIFKLTHGRKQDLLNSLIKTFTFIPPMNGVKILSVEKTDLYEDVWDITVFDNEHCFELSQVISGNCGEVPLGKYNACDLGSLNLPNFISGKKSTNWRKLEEVIRLAIRFLDNVLDINKYILKEIEVSCRNNRRIGLGFMGLAEYLFAKEVRYGSEKSIQEVEKLTKFIRNIAYEESVKLAIEKGAFPKFDSVYFGKSHFVRSLPASLRMNIKENGIRNVTLMAIAPTGTISNLPEVTGGIEPLTYKSYQKRDYVGNRIYVNKIYKELLESNEKVPEWFVDSDDLKPEDHFEMQAIVQKYVDGSVSKTINMPKGSNKKDLNRLLLEYIHDIKGCTIYVDGSKGEQPYQRLTEKETKEFLKQENTEIQENIDEELTECKTGNCEI